MTKRSTAILIQTVVTLSPPLGVIFPWLQVIIPTAYCFVVPSDGPPFSEAYLPLVGLVAVGLGLTALIVHSVSKSQSTRLLRVFVWYHILYSALALVIWGIFFGSRFIINFPIREVGFYVAFAMLAVPHVAWIFILIWCRRQLKSQLIVSSGAQSLSAPAPWVPYRRWGFLAGPGLVVVAIIAAIIYKPSSPLHEAVLSGDAETMQRLLKEDPSLLNSEPMHEGFDPPLVVAIRNNDAPMIKKLLEMGADVNMSYGGGSTPMSTAIWTGNTAAIELLLEHGVDVNKPGVFGRTPLIEAAGVRKPAVLMALLRVGADVNASIVVGRGNSSDRILLTPLKRAAEAEDSESVRILIDHGADANIKGPNDDAAIHAGFGSLAVLKLLVQAGANVNERGYKNRTPLHLAAEGDILYNPTTQQNYYRPVDTATVSYLLANGAEVDALDDDGMTPLAYAEKNGHIETANLIRVYGAKAQPGKPDSTEVERP